MEHARPRWGPFVWPVLIALGLLTWGMRPRRVRVHVVGAGLVALVREEDAPPGTRYVLNVEPHATFAETRARFADVVGLWPDVVVLGLDGAELRGGADAIEEAKRVLADLTTHAENATAVPVVLSVTPDARASDDARRAASELHVWWRDVLCRRGGLRLCVDLEPHVESPAEIRLAVRAAVLDALVRHEQLRASTQEGAVLAPP